MYAGKIIEFGSTQKIVSNPVHPYTQGLIKSIPGVMKPGGKLYQIPGMMPNLTEIPVGCAFNPRCDIREDICRQEVPMLLSKKNAVLAACHLKK